MGEVVPLGRFTATMLVSMQEVALLHEPWAAFDSIFERVGWIAREGSVRIHVDEELPDCWRITLEA